MTVDDKQIKFGAASSISSGIDGDSSSGHTDRI